MMMLLVISAGCGPLPQQGKHDYDVICDTGQDGNKTNCRAEQRCGGSPCLRVEETLSQKVGRLNPDEAREIEEHVDALLQKQTH